MKQRRSSTIAVIERTKLLSVSLQRSPEELKRSVEEEIYVKTQKTVNRNLLLQAVNEKKDNLMKMRETLERVSFAERLKKKEDTAKVINELKQMKRKQLDDTRIEKIVQNMRQQEKLSSVFREKAARRAQITQATRSLMNLKHGLVREKKRLSGKTAVYSNQISGIKELPQRMAFDCSKLHHQSLDVSEMESMNNCHSCSFEVTSSGDNVEDSFSNPDDDEACYRVDKGYLTLDWIYDEILETILGEDVVIPALMLKFDEDEEQFPSANNLLEEEPPDPTYPS